jgi:hypothetical protein
MRNPKSRGKGPATGPAPAGGRAWARVMQFAISRGLPLEPTPEAKKSGQTPPQSAKPAPKRVRKGPVKPTPKARSK